MSEFKCNTCRDYGVVYTLLTNTQLECPDCVDKSDTVTIKRSELEEALVAVRIANIKTYGGFVNITKILETALEKK
jgi:hypothetical protein